MSNVKNICIIARYNCYSARIDCPVEYEAIAMQLGIMRMNPVLGLDFEVEEIDGYDCKIEIKGTEAVSYQFVDVLLLNLSKFAKIETSSIVDIENNIQIS